MKQRFQFQNEGLYSNKTITCKTFEGNSIDELQQKANEYSNSINTNKVTPLTVHNSKWFNNKNN